MPRWLYTFLLALLTPAVLAWMAWRGWRNPAHRGSLSERLAFGLSPRQDRPVWLHAASVGEVQSLAGLVRLLLQHRPDQPLLVTVGSPTGVTRARSLFVAPQVTVLLAPFDLPGVVRRFLGASRPSAGVFVETEIWPNMISAAAKSGVPLTMVSARVSERSTRSYLRFAPGLVRRTLARFSGIGTQSAADASRFVRLGADMARVQVIGNLKFDFPIPSDIGDRGHALRTRYAPGRPMWIAGSTHAGEEEVCLAAHRRLVDSVANGGGPLLVMAPRRAERFDAVADWLGAKGVAFARHSGEGAADSTSIEVLLVDTLGELLAFYAAGDVAFVGGSLVPVGGHNLLEPAALGKPTISGPHSFNSPEAARLLDEAGALTWIHDAGELAAVLERLMGDPVAAAALGQRGAAAVVANQGSAARALVMLRSLIEAS